MSKSILTDNQKANLTLAKKIGDLRYEELVLTLMMMCNLSQAQVEYKINTILEEK